MFEHYFIVYMLNVCVRLVYLIFIVQFSFVNWNVDFIDN